MNPGSSPLRHEKTQVLRPGLFSCGRWGAACQRHASSADRAGGETMNPGSRCGRWDLNPHDVTVTRSLVLLVCQFRHFRERKVSYQMDGYLSTPSVKFSFPVTGSVFDPLKTLLDHVVDDLKCADAGVIFVVALDDMPGGEIGGCISDHIVHGCFILVPFFPVAPVLIRDLPLLGRISLTGVEALQLLVIRNVDPEFDDYRAPVIELSFISP